MILGRVSRCATLVALAIFSPFPLQAQKCLQPLPTSGITPQDQTFLEDFSAALRRFKGMSLEDFVAEYGPKKAYREGGVPSFIRGDANGDGKVDLSDAVCTLSRLFLGTGSCQSVLCEDALDTNDDGKIDVSDPVYLLDFLFLGGPEPPAPFLVPGKDLTDDALGCGNSDVPKLDYNPREAEYFTSNPAHPDHGGILQTYPMIDSQMGAFEENGFVILKDQKYATFFQALDRVFNDYLPVYISADTLLDALHLSFDDALRTVEEELLIGKLDQMLTKMESGIEGLRRYAGAADIEIDLDRVAFWICAARSLLHGEKSPCLRGVDEQVDEFLGYVASESIVGLELFGISCDQVGKPLLEDFSQFKPRGHYTQSERLEHYFRAMMWVQRIGMRFAQSEEHAAVAYLLTRDLLDTRAIAEWETINGVVELFVGNFDSLGPQGLADLVQSAGIAGVGDLYNKGSFDAFVKAALESGAGRQLINSQILSADPSYVDGFTPTPPVYNLMGQRFIVDSFIFSNAVNDKVPGRPLPSPLDAWFVLGNRATLPLLSGELETWKYQSNLAAMDWIVSRYPEDFWKQNLYNIWLSTLQALSADTTRAPYPSVMQTKEWDQKCLHTQLASWAQLRHDTILYAKQSYEGGDCDYPEGWVDPYPKLYQSLTQFAQRAIPWFEARGLFDLPSGPLLRRWLHGLESHSQTLAGIAQAELDGLTLTEEQAAFLKGTLKWLPTCQPHSGCFPYNGWYLDLVFGFIDWPSFKPTIADIHTCPAGPICANTQVLHVGVGHVNLMLLSVKTDCALRAYVGPVFSYHEFVRQGDPPQRLNDEEWLQELEDSVTNGIEPPRPEWTQSFIR
jgi:hypothetical protein